MNIKKLREIASAATPGPLFEMDGERILVNLEQLPTNANGLLAEVGDPTKMEPMGRQTPQTNANAKFIATFNPETVLRLLDMIERYQAALKFYADRKNWAGESYKSECLDKIKNDVVDDGFACPSGGARAREALRADAEENKP